MRGGLSVLFLLLAACSGEFRGNTSRVEVPPDAFALLPCEPETRAPCALAVAGGKRVMFGAPAGAARALAQEDLSQLDAIMLFSLRAEDLEGLDELRNRSWHAGRRLPLLVAGPAGTGAAVAGLNMAYENADALRIVDDGMPPGGFDAALLQDYELSALAAWDSPFDTGDFRIEGQESLGGHVRWRLVYVDEDDGEVDVLLEPCSDSLPDLDTVLLDAPRIGCAADDMSGWPITSPVWLVQGGEKDG